VVLYGCPAGAGSRAHQDDAAEGGEERYSIRSTFETSKYNSYNIRLKTVETPKHASETLKKTPKNI
jgi:hypothetical protein